VGGCLGEHARRDRSPARPEPTARFVTAKGRANLPYSGFDFNTTRLV
jgi:hypothetical protein